MRTAPFPKTSATTPARQGSSERCPVCYQLVDMKYASCYSRGGANHEGACRQDYPAEWAAADAWNAREPSGRRRQGGL